MANARSPEMRVASLNVSFFICVTLTCSVPSPMPRTHTGFFAQSRARSGRVSTTAPPASVTRQMLSSVNG